MLRLEQEDVLPHGKEGLLPGEGVDGRGWARNSEKAVMHLRTVQRLPPMPPGVGGSVDQKSRGLGTEPKGS